MDDTKRTAGSTQQTADQMVRRDGELYIGLGIYIAAVGLPVVIGTYWAAQRSDHAAVVNAICGLALLLIGAASLVYGWVLLKKAKARM